MKKLILIPFICLLMANVSNGQAKFKVGVAGGANMANLSGSDVTNNSGVTGFNAGLITEIKLPVKLGIEADILFSTKGAIFDFPMFIAIDDPALDPSIPKDTEISLTYIDVPVLLKIYTAKVLSFQLGPQYSILTGAKANDNDVKGAYNSGDLSAVVGIGLDVSLVHFSCRYNYGLTSIASGADVKNNMLTFSLGIWLRK